VIASLARRRTPTAVLALGAAVALQLACAPAVAAAQGAALDTGRIVVQTPLVVGKSYQLAKLGVRNPGTQRTKYDLVVTPIATDALTPQPGWFSFSPKHVTIKAGRQQTVTVSIRVPKNAAAGRYEALVGAQISSSGGMAIAAGAAARLSFSVAGQTAADPIVSVLGIWWPAPAAALLIGGLWLTRGRRIRLRSPIQRR
jgi:hypothetical protein